MAQNPPPNTTEDQALLSAPDTSANPVATVAPGEGNGAPVTASVTISGNGANGANNVSETPPDETANTTSTSMPDQPSISLPYTQLKQSSAGSSATAREVLQGNANTAGGSDEQRTDTTQPATETSDHSVPAANEMTEEEKNETAKNNKGSEQPETEIKKLNFGQRLVKNVGGGVFNGMIASFIRVGFMGLCLGTMLAAAGAILGPPTLFFFPLFMQMAVPLGLWGGVGGAVAGGGIKFATGLLKSIKDEIFNPNADAVVVPVEKGKGQGQEKEHQHTNDVSEGKPYLLEDSITEGGPEKKPRPADPEAKVDEPKKARPQHKDAQVDDASPDKGGDQAEKPKAPLPLHKDARYDGERVPKQSEATQDGPKDVGKSDEKRPLGPEENQMVENQMDENGKWAKRFTKAPDKQPGQWTNYVKKPPENENSGVGGPG